MNLLRFRKQPVTVDMSSDGTVRVRAGHRSVDSIHLGPNEVSAIIVHNPGCGHGVSDWEIEDLGISYNLLITSSAGGRDIFAGMGGGLLATGGQGSPNTAATATTLTGTGSVWTTNLLAGMQVVSPITGITTAPVYGRIISNTTNVITIDQWSTATDTVGTTPATGNAFTILPGGMPARYMGLTENAAASLASDTALTGEITTGGCGRALATYAHTLATATYTLQKAFSVTASFPAIHKMGIWPTLTASNGPLTFESDLNANANVVNLDTLTVTDTVTVS